MALVCKRLFVIILTDLLLLSYFEISETELKSILLESYVCMLAKRPGMIIVITVIMLRILLLSIA
jgi:hypothetical protein